MEFEDRESEWDVFPGGFSLRREGLQAVRENDDAGEDGDNHLGVTSADVLRQRIDTSAGLSARREGIDGVGEVVSREHFAIGALWHDALEDSDDWSRVGKSRITESAN